MTAVYTTTQTFTDSGEVEYIVANAPSSTGTLALEYAVSNEWASAGEIFAGEAKVVKTKRGAVRFTVTGTVTYTVY